MAKTSQGWSRCPESHNIPKTHANPGMLPRHYGEDLQPAGIGCHRSRRKVAVRDPSSASRRRSISATSRRAPGSRRAVAAVGPRRYGASSTVYRRTGESSLFARCCTGP